MKAIFAAAAALTGWYALTLLKIDGDRERRRAAIASATSSLRTAATPEQNKATLDSLASAGLAEHLEPLAIQGLVGFVGDKTRRVDDCRRSASPAQGPMILQRANVDQALQLIREFQSTGRKSHSYPDRVIDATLAMWHGEQNATRRPLRFDGADVRAANFRRMDLRAASFVGTCLAGARLDSAQLGAASFSQAHLDSAVLDMATLDGTSFKLASLRFASLQGARGRQTIFDRSDLTAADLTGVRLDSANFHSATLSCATIGNATISRAYFSSAVAYWTYFGGDSLIDVQRWHEIRGMRGAYLAQVQGLSDEMIAFARDSGAVPDTTDQIEWTARKGAQLRHEGLCVPKK